MAEFNPAAFISAPLTPAESMRMQQHSVDQFTDNFRQGAAFREDRRRFDEKMGFERSEADRRQGNFEAQLGVQQGYLDLSRDKFGMQQETFERERRSMQTKAIFDALTKTRTADEANAVLELAGYEHGIEVIPDPSAAGIAAQGSPVPEPEAPGSPMDGVLAAAKRFEAAADSSFIVPPSADNLGVTGGPVPRVNEVVGGEPNHAMYAEMSGLRNTGLSRGEMREQSHAIRDKFDPQASFQSLVDAQPFEAYERDAIAEHQQALQASFQKRSLRLQGMGLAPEQLQVAMALAAQAHGMPAPAPVMTPPPPDAPPGAEPIMPSVPPEVAELAAAPPEVPRNYVAEASQAGGFALVDRKTGQLIGKLDWVAMKQAREQQALQQWMPLVDMVQSPTDRARFAKALENYAKTGDQNSLNILHWLLQRDAQQQIGLTLADQLKLQSDERSQARLERDYYKEFQNVIKGNIDRFARNYDLKGMNSELKNLEKSMSLIKSDSPMDQRVALSQLVTGIFGKMVSNAERENITTTGLRSKVDEAVNYLSSDAQLSKQQIQNLQDLMRSMTAMATKIRASSAKSLRRNLANDPDAIYWLSKLGMDEKHLDRVAEQRVSDLFEGGLDVSGPDVSDSGDVNEVEITPDMEW